ncbi:putative transcription factor/ chromatin remodeling BED-type(Zn) family protein [Tanacetum coccineum]
MTTTTTTTPPLPSSSPPPLSVATTDETAVKNVNKRYEGLMMVRTKAIKGKGAWYWSHLEPILVHNNNNVVRQQVKLRCCLCGAVFSASNPSRTATEHLKRGTCPNFKSDPNSNNPTPISSISPSGHVSMMTSSSLSPTGMMTSSQVSNNRKRGKAAQSVAPITMTRPDPVGGSGLYLTHNQQYNHFYKLSGGKEDLNALALLEDSVKKLKSPKIESSFGGQKLARSQIDASFDMLADWVYENCGSVSFSSLNHVKFKAFLSQVGLPAITGRELAGERLNSKYLIAKNESEARIRDAMFFQMSSNGWTHCKCRTDDGGENDRNLVNLSVNLPNGTSVFRRGVFTNGYVFSKYAEDVLMETIVEICGNNLQKCVGIVSDKFKMKALKNLENQHHWMVNLSCQYRGVGKLAQDFVKELPVFKNVIDGCYKVANFVNMNSQIRHSFLKYQFQELGRSRLFQIPKFEFEFEFEVVFSMVEDVFSSSRVLQLVLLDESNKVVSMEVVETIKSSQFWRETEGVHSLVRLVKDMAREIEKERPRIGQCLPLWEELRVKIKEWCLKYEMNEIHVEKIFDKRFRKNYHPAWAAAFILDPFYLIRDRSGKYLPPFKCLTSEQEKDVDKLITRLVSREEAHIVLMELMKWRTDGLDPVYAQAVQLKQRDPITGKMKIANPQSSRLVWETYLTEFNSLRKVAVRLIFLHATSCEFKWNWSISRFCQLRNNGIDKAQKLIFIAANAKPEKREFTNDDAKEADFFAVANGENDMLNEVLFDATPP